MFQLLKSIVVVFCWSALAGAFYPVWACTLTPFDAALTRCAGAERHPLCGKVLSLKTLQLSEASSGTCPSGRAAALQGEIAQAIEAGGIIILGEVHDNPAHHLLRSSLVAGAGAIVFEQLRADQQQQIDALFAGNAGIITTKDFKAAVNWIKSGWDAASYDPLLDAVLASSLPVFAGDVSRGEMMKLAKQGLGALTDAERRRLSLSKPLLPPLEKASLIEIDDAHCGALPQEALPGMAAAQRYRDAHLADVTLTAAVKHGSAILITGNNHARTDRGVPWYLREREPKRPVLSVMFVEVQPDEFDAASYIPRDPEGNPVADYIVFTPPVARGDPCEKFRAKKAG